MRNGCMVMGLHIGSQEERRLADNVIAYLSSKGRKNVFSAFLYGEDPFEVMASKFNDEGIDTFSIIPLCISEGQQSIWDMPAAIHLPDNSGSWTMVGEHDVATRFATALGRDPSMAEAIAESLGEPKGDTGILLLAYGSNLSQCGKTADYYTEYIRSKGWKASFAFTKLGTPKVSDAADELVSDGCSKITVVPLFTTFSGKSAESAKDALRDIGADVSYTEPVSRLQAFMEIIDSKIPEGW